MKRKGYIASGIDYSDLWEVCRGVQQYIRREFHPSDLREFPEDTAGIDITIGTDGESWAYQTGDNSFIGPVYSYQYWSVGWIPYRGALWPSIEQLVNEIEENEIRMIEDDLRTEYRQRNYE